MNAETEQARAPVVARIGPQSMPHLTGPVDRVGKAALALAPRLDPTPPLGPAPSSAPSPLRTAEPAGRTDLGSFLATSGWLAAGDLARATALRAETEARLGDILLAEGLIAPDDFWAGAAAWLGAARLDAGEPIDPRLLDRLGADRALAQGLLPVRRTGAATLVATCRPEEAGGRIDALEALFGPVALAVMDEDALVAAILRLRRHALTARAESRVTADLSCRDWRTKRVGRTLAAALAVTLAAILLAPTLAGIVLFGWAALTLLAWTALRAAALLARRGLSPPPAATQPTSIARRPVVSLLVPLFREREIAATLVRRLERLDYPRACLDICLVVERNDTLTQATLAATDLPAHMRAILVPRGRVQTKPRALNYALDFARGSIIGVYDAEDAPAPDQITRVTERFREAPEDVACLQGILDFYNARQNWLARCFALEYAAWFRILLPGLTRLGLVVPLGGTTLFFRRAALEKLGGWDAHNVTEDADLGLRLARRGFRTEIIDTVTQEEANARPWPWVRQRSRWLKGYAMTYATHMRRPRALWRDLGPRRFLGVQVLFLGTLSQFVLAPLLWTFWLPPLGLSHPLLATAPAWIVWVMLTLFFCSEVTALLTNIWGVARRGRRWLIPWAPTLIAYFPLGAAAAYKGLAEMALCPFFWDKTQHGEAPARRPARRWRRVRPARGPEARLRPRAIGA